MFDVRKPALLFTVSFVCVWSMQAVKHEKFGASLLTALFEPLQRNTLEHWHESVKSMSEEILQLYQLELPVVYDQCVQRYNARHAHALPPSMEHEDGETFDMPEPAQAQ